MLARRRLPRHLGRMLSRIGEIVRRYDPDRFFTALFVRPDHRETLLTLYAFNHELARAREAASEPTLALIRLHWWREVVEGADKRHEVATPLSSAIDAGALAPADLLGMIDAREAEVEPSIPTRAAWRAYLMGAAGGVAVAAARTLGAPDPERARPIGAAYGAGGVLRGRAALARQGRCLLPEDALGAHGLTVEAALRDPDGPAIRAAVAELAREALALLKTGRALPKPAAPATLVGALARRDLRRAERLAQPRGFGDKLAVTWAARR